MLDMVIVNGRIADGTGNPLQRADVAISGGRVVDVGWFPDAVAAERIDATGKVVCPGFVDPHSHSDITIHVNPTAESTIRQGVTTEIVGNCGLTLAPVSGASLTEVDAGMREYGFEGEVEWRTFEEYLGVVDAAGTSQNLGWLVGHNAVRAAAGIGNAEPTADQMDRMRGHVAEAMAAGALGMSTGLEFAPGKWASTDEIVELNKVVGRHGGIYASHVRNRDAHLRESTEEFLRIVREGGTRGEYSHLNVRHNTGAASGAWRETLDMLETAREVEGLEVLADTTPFHDGIGAMSAILPTWLTDRPVDEVMVALGDPDVRARLKEDCDRYWRFLAKGEWHRVRLLSGSTHPEFVGKTFFEIAELMGGDPFDAFFDILRESGDAYHNMRMVGRLFTDEHLAEMISHPLISLGVDCFTSSVSGPLAEMLRHPFPFAGHVHYLTHHVRERGTLRLEEAIRKMTSMPATQFGLRDRGMLKPGFAADVVVFDYDRLNDVSTIEDPLHYVAGVDLVLVNGEVTVRDGDHTGARAGDRLSAA